MLQGRNYHLHIKDKKTKVKRLIESLKSGHSDSKAHAPPAPLQCFHRAGAATARRSNQSILKETNPEYSLERLMLKLKLQFFGHLMQRANSLEKTLILGKFEGRRRGL